MSIEDSLSSIARDIKRIADCLCGREPGSLAGRHGEPTPEKEIIIMKPAKLGMKRQPHHGANVPSGDRDVFTIAILDDSTPPVPYTGPAPTSVVGTSGDPSILTLDTPTGLDFGEHFLKAGTVTNHYVVTFPGGKELSLDDVVTITGQPGSLVGSHSAPVVGP